MSEIGVYRVDIRERGSLRARPLICLVGGYNQEKTIYDTYGNNVKIERVKRLGGLSRECSSELLGCLSDANGSIRDVGGDIGLRLIEY